ncbi:Transcriptional regulator PadR-like family protein [Halorubrum ezzemoulense]|uniref:Transcriptional regulator PadR-like family protein n=1 Tax=Halorubrum ezzemoulense TaxID=337243 RepID=A0A238YHT8_HALEZ|nr:PadR family transcriptional regulator [Halorubrum ezzemoulense]SNR70542.1 Transcriptional regulator PadR-like family protein [Halorubrum ezzemoulense]
MNEDTVVSDLADYTAFQRDLLWALSHDNTHNGRSLKTELDDYYGEDLDHGRLAQTLDALVEDDFVAKRARDERTPEYRLTEHGRRALSARQAWQAGHRGDTTSEEHS